MTKCRSCGKYEIRKKEIGTTILENHFDIELIKCSEWKWCLMKNNWCRNVSAHCEYIIPIEHQQIKLKENKLL